VNILSLTKRLYHVATQITFLLICIYESVCWYHTLGFSIVITFIYSTFLCLGSTHCFWLYYVVFGTCILSNYSDPRMWGISSMVLYFRSVQVA